MPPRSLLIDREGSGAVRGAGRGQGLYDDQTYWNQLRSWGKRPLIKHREFAPYDKAANTHNPSAVKFVLLHGLFPLADSLADGWRSH
jgi:hypothetical protein